MEHGGATKLCVAGNHQESALGKEKKRIPFVWSVYRAVGHIGGGMRTLKTRKVIAASETW